MRIKDDSALAAGRNGAPQNARFIPRNFLIEEHLDGSRANTYAASFPNAGPMDFAEWNIAHNQYLEEHIFTKPTATHNYHLVPQDDAGACSETFRSGPALIPFQRTDFDTYFIRVIPASDLAYLAQENEARIFSLGEQVVVNPSASGPAHQELSRIFDEAFYGPRCDHRPVFAAFYDDFLNELRDPEDVAWAGQLRDRLGLYHINQWQVGGLPRRVFLFRYQVRELPRHPGDSERRPIAIPMVLDHRLSEAFCPAPQELDKGRLLNLQADAVEEPVREVLHLFMPMQVKHLFRVGLITTPVPEDLNSVRRDHLIWVRLQANRDAYAAGTDADLFQV